MPSADPVHGAPSGGSRLRSTARAARDTARLARVRLLAADLGARCRRAGGALALDATAAPRLATRPTLRVSADGGPGGTLHLRLGTGVRIGRGVLLEVWAGTDNRLELGDHCHVEDDVRLILRGGCIRVADHVQLRSGALLKSEGELVIGAHALVGSWCALNCASSVELGAHVALGERVSVLDSDHLLDGSDTPFLDRPLRLGPVAIGANTMVGTNAVLTRGARIGPNSAVGAGAVVGRGEHPEGWLLAGAPARPVRALAPEESAP